MYWKERHTVNNINHWDECTKYFHAMATISRRRNIISQILNDQGAWIQDHEGISTGSTMHYDIASLIHLEVGLTNLLAPFEHSEIDKIIKAILTDKAAGPDGFMVYS
jgi:hypothetical protein